MTNTNLFDEKVGLLRRGTIVGYDARKGIIKVQLNNAISVKGNNHQPVDVSVPHSMFYNNGLFIGTAPHVDTPVVVAQGSGGHYHFVSYVAENLKYVPELELGQLLIRTNDNTKITLDLDNNISLGSNNEQIHINTDSNLITTNFYNENHFTQATRSVNGLIKRDLKPNPNYTQDIKLESDKYDSELYFIGLDSSVTTNVISGGSNKNPSFAENRELVYEFQYDSDITDDFNESLLYSDTPPPHNIYTLPNRRASRSDTLSLTLASPNYLMETVKGTVVDIFGNILDINRNPIPIGQDQNTIQADNASDKSAAYLRIKELERKSIAYHFEINARKDLSGNGGKISLPDINSNADYSKLRSRFFVDIDKEGQIKANIPASSEKGNIPLLVRYENYSTFGTEDNGNPNKLIRRDDNLDIFQDSFAAPKATITDNGFSYSQERGSIQIKDGNSDGAPLDRITQSHIKHGTVYHDILQTCYASQTNNYLQYDYKESVTPTVNVDSFSVIKKVVSDTINVSGSNANAGGRSGSINFDGSLEMNIGANSIDRQSLWLDTAGGIVANIGRDKQMRSAAVSMNGDVFFQIGGWGIVGDSRFKNDYNNSYGAVLDLRVVNSGGRAHLFRIDDNGITIMTPGNLAIQAAKDIKITCSSMEIDCAVLTVQGRLVNKETGGSI